MPKQLLSISEAANYLHVSPKTLRRWEERRLISPFRTNGNQRRYSLEELNQVKEGHPTPPALEEVFLSIGKAAEQLGISTKTLRRWDKQGILLPVRTAGGQRKYTKESLNNIKEQKPLPSQRAAPPQKTPPIRVWTLEEIRAPFRPRHPLRKLAVVVLAIALVIQLWLALPPLSKKRLERAFSPSPINPIVDVNDIFEYKIGEAGNVRIWAKFLLEADNLVTKTLNIIESGVFNTTRFLGTLFFGEGKKYFITPLADAFLRSLTLSDKAIIPKLEASSIKAKEIQADSIDANLDWKNLTNRPPVVSSVDGVTNDGGDINLIAGANLAITPNDAANTIILSVTGTVGNADLLDSLDSSQFLRSDTSDQLTSGTLTLDVGTTLDINGTLAWGGATISEALDFNGLADALVLDSDGDTSISAPTDDQIDIEIGGADDFTFTTGRFNVLSGSFIDMDGNPNPLVFDAAGVVFMEAVTAGTLDVVFAPNTDWRFTANSLDAYDNTILNIGNPGTDFTTTGGLILADELLLPNGSVFAPALAFSGDTDTGIFQQTTNWLSFATLGTERLVIKTDKIAALVPLDMWGSGATSVIENIGVMGTDFSATGGLTLAGDLVANANVTLGDTSTDVVVFNAYVQSHIIPIDNTRNLGSAANRWDIGYFDDVLANNIYGVILGGETNSPDWRINADNGTDDLEDVTLTFERGTPVTNAVLRWDSTNDRFRFETFPVYLDNDLAVAGGDITSSAATLVINAAGAVDIQDNLTADSLTTDVGGVSIAAGQSYTGAGAVTLSSGGANTLTIDTGGAAALNIGTTNQNALTLGRATINTTINGANIILGAQGDATTEAVRADRSLTFTQDTNVTITNSGVAQNLTADRSWTLGWSGQLAPSRGGTGDDTSATTGVPYISSGDWLYEAQLAVARGGTGASTLTQYGVLYGNATSAIGATAAGATDQVLLGNTSAAPSWGTVGGAAITNNSLDFADFVDSMTLDANLAISASASNYSINIDSDTLFVDAANNSVGIGDTTPTEGKLVVAGTIYATTQATGVNEAVLGGRTLTASTGLSGGGNLTADRSFSVVYGSTASTSAQGNVNLTGPGAGTGLTGGGGAIAVGAGGTFTTINVAGGTCITANADDLAVTGDCIGDTQLAYNTGQHLTTSSTPQFARLGLGAAADGTYLLNLNGALVHGTSTGVGIGTTSPGANLNINGADWSGGLMLTGGDSTSIIIAPDKNHHWSYNSIYGDASGNFTLQSRWDGTNKDLILNPNAGNVGIGTTGPGAKLEVAGKLSVSGDYVATTGLNALHFGFGSNTGKIYALQEGTAWRQLNIEGSTIALNTISGGNVGIGTTGPLSKLSVGGAGAAGYGIYTTGASTGVQAIGSSDGVVGQGGTRGVLGWSIAASAGIGVEGYNVNATGYGLYCTSGNVNGCGGNRAWFNASDRKLKENIVPISGALAKVLNLQGVTFNLKSDLAKTPQMGFIAQDVLPYVPEVVAYDESNDYYGMQTSQLTALLVNAVQELNSKVEELEMRIDGDGDAAQTNSDGSTTKITVETVEAEEGWFDKLTIAVEAIFDHVKAQAIDVLGTLTAKLIKTERLETEEIILNGRALADTSTGTAMIPVGSTSLTINSPLITNHSKIFLTPLDSTNGQLLFVSKKEEGRFSVSIDTPLEHEVRFDYWIVN